VPDINALARKAHEMGAILSINHPDAPGGEICRGCDWAPNPPVDMNLITAVEPINGGDGDGYVSSFKFWKKQLALGYRPTAIGGSDNHVPNRSFEHPGSIGSPTTVVYASELSVPGILNGIRAGHVFIDLSGSGDRLLEVTATDSRGKAGMGDTLSAPKDEVVQLAIHLENCGTNRVQILLDGETPIAIEHDVTPNPDQAPAITLNTTWKSDGKRHWLAPEVRDTTGALYLLGNPVYINY
jgi:hypothetical protein